MKARQCVLTRLGRGRSHPLAARLNPFAMSTSDVSTSSHRAIKCCELWEVELRGLGNGRGSKQLQHLLKCARRQRIQASPTFIVISLTSLIEHNPTTQNAKRPKPDTTNLHHPHAFAASRTRTKGNFLSFTDSEPTHAKVGLLAPHDSSREAWNPPRDTEMRGQ